jgi:hypothetical protein
MERIMEAAIEAAYRACFLPVAIGGETFELRIPFGQEGERKDDCYSQSILG